MNDSFWVDSFETAAKNTGLDTVATVTTKMCQMYLGLSKKIIWSKDADDKLCLKLMKSLLSSGNFDRKRGKGSAIETAISNVSRKGLFRYLQTAGEFNWEAYRKHKWLKPFAWFYQIGRYARQGFQVKRGKLLREDVKRGKQRGDLVKQLKIGNGR